MDKTEKVQAGKFLENQLKISKQWFIDSHIGNIKEVYHFQERLGAGGFGVVYLAKHRKNEGMYAVKAIQKSRIRDYETF